MKRLLPRWRLPRAGRRLLLHWRAARFPAEAYWPAAEYDPGITGVPRDEQDRAIDTACRMLGVSRIGALRSGIIGHSVSSEARSANGERCWLKISLAARNRERWSLEGERDVRRLGGVPTPAILGETEWADGSRSWHAFQFEFLPSPAIQRAPWISAPMPRLEDEWFANLKQAMERLAAAPLSRWLVHPGTVVRTIARRFGRKAPYDIDEWRMAHGDLNWSNITAPTLMLIDWESWGAAPRGFDIASLIVNSMHDVELRERLEHEFTDDLQSRSGIVARLFTIGRKLNRIEAGLFDPREHAPLEREAKRLLRL